MTNYASFAPWDPESSDFPYDKSAYEDAGFKLRARLDKRNPDLEQLKLDLEKEGAEVKLSSLGEDNQQVDVWYR